MSTASQRKTFCFVKKLNATAMKQNRITTVTENKLRGEKQKKQKKKRNSEKTKTTTNTESSKNCWRTIDIDGRAKKMWQRRWRQRQQQQQQQPHHEKVVLQKNARKYFQSIASRARSRACTLARLQNYSPLHEHMYLPVSQCPMVWVPCSSFVRAINPFILTILMFIVKHV